MEKRVDVEVIKKGKGTNIVHFLSKFQVFDLNLRKEWYKFYTFTFE